MRWLQAAVLSSLWLAAPASAATYKVDPDHSTVGFTVRHLFSKVRGAFDQYEASFVYVPGAPEQWSAKATIQAESINTKVVARDKHLRSSDFFDVAKHPTITFESTGVSQATATSAQLQGNLTIRGVTQPVTLDVAILGVATDPWGNERAGFTATTTINRRDFGLDWNEALETGQLLVGEEVTLELEVEGIAQQ
jgi:polyisoprenoid-binding protein YceI